MSIGGWLFAAMYDRVTAGPEAAGLGAFRERLLREARGDLLEIGAGTGANLQYYPSSVGTITLVEPEAPMARRLSRRVQGQPRAVAIVNAPAERLPLPDAHYDTVVCTLVLCTVRDLAAALGEMRRAMKPDGRLLFLEHVRSENPRLAKWQDRLNPLNRIVAHGCNCNRATVDAIRAAGFSIASLAHEELPKAPPFVRPLVIGTATRSDGR
jgi:ubiquinone/menaquinone biosynthesis C-methylase UbiE